MQILGGGFQIAVTEQNRANSLTVERNNAAPQQRQKPGVNNRLEVSEPIQKVVESEESVVIRYMVPVIERGTRCGPQSTAD